MYDIDDEDIVAIMEVSRDSGWYRSRTKWFLEDLGRFTETEIDEILGYYKGWYKE